MLEDFKKMANMFICNNTDLFNAVALTWNRRGDEKKQTAVEKWKGLDETQFIRKLSHLFLSVPRNRAIVNLFNKFKSADLHLHFVKCRANKSRE